MPGLNLNRINSKLDCQIIINKKLSRVNCKMFIQRDQVIVRLNATPIVRDSLLRVTCKNY